jgi:hypothetical protein
VSEEAGPSELVVVLYVTAEELGVVVAGNEILQFE